MSRYLDRPWNATRGASRFSSDRLPARSDLPAASWNEGTSTFMLRGLPTVPLAEAFAPTFTSGTSASCLGATSATSCRTGIIGASTVPWKLCRADLPVPCVRRLPAALMVQLAIVSSTRSARSRFGSATATSSSTSGVPGGLRNCPGTSIEAGVRSSFASTCPVPAAAPLPLACRVKGPRRTAPAVRSSGG